MVGNVSPDTLARVIDLRELREDPEAVRASQRARGEDESLADAALVADARRRALTAEAETLRAEQKTFGRRVATARGEDKAALVAQARQLSERVKAAQQLAEEAGAELEALLWRIPNVVADGVPAGGQDDFTVLREVGRVRDFAAEGFAPRAVSMARSDSPASAPGSSWPCSPWPWTPPWRRASPRWSRRPWCAAR
jgi:seryl-tRNA synthetase